MAWVDSSDMLICFKLKKCGILKNLDGVLNGVCFFDISSGSFPAMKATLQTFGNFLSLDNVFVRRILLPPNVPKGSKINPVII